MFTGLSAFPLTPLHDDHLDEPAFVRIIERLASAGVDSIGTLGSTGSYAYLDRTERARTVTLAVQHAAGVPVIAGIGALRQAHVLRYADDAQQAGASGLLLAPVSYQPLHPDEVYHLFEQVTARIAVPLVVYDNPRTTGFTFTDDLYAAVAKLPHVTSIKVPPLPVTAPIARDRVTAIRALLPAHVGIGVSGDPVAAVALHAGCDAWYSVIGGTLPTAALAITRAPDPAAAKAASDRLRPLWELFAAHGSLRVVAAIAEHLTLTGPDSLPRPIRGLDTTARRAVIHALTEAGLDH
ncbi:dihydrodipicolinate synthase family protein [Actinoplanes derwentensis]|uniref:4-hydroxy-tetrahydrodipicolinate synthase n=1 Tax=Actinoplanes derwentensis TaxID=113562 RepID=A0A1H1WDC6_9ACTN|nr:dihydrodipicolinate synthase family protein [Actinoplanes derwentensis]GID84110.1 dihydrodipicolinate synthase family protein [Actinoplanes derwentensis]SDS94139.1 4-hydroxy-tetrahydrodipicolinate synthase [Actinoplanes derwentensis]